MRVIIAGSRDFDDYDKLCHFCDYVLRDQKEIEIVSGTAKGADQLGERYAVERGYPVKQFPADWNKGKSAGYFRNEEMAKYGDALIAFWNGTSKGTENMINLAKQYNLKIRIYNYLNLIKKT
jgi:hypothetical protein